MQASNMFTQPMEDVALEAYERGLEVAPKAGEAAEEAADLAVQKAREAVAWATEDPNRVWLRRIGGAMLTIAVVALAVAVAKKLRSKPAEHLSAVDGNHRSDSAEAA